MAFHTFKSIGIKELSQPDMGIKESSNQSHIGLYNTISESIWVDKHHESTVVYGKLRFRAMTLIDPITNKRDGSKRSPKIRSGESRPANNPELDALSVTRAIQQIIRDSPHDGTWHLLWAEDFFGGLSFLLFESRSQDWDSLAEIFQDSKGKQERTLKKVKLKSGDEYFDSVCEFLAHRVLDEKEAAKMELEFAVQLGETRLKRRRFTLKQYKAMQTAMEETGRRGEELVREYLEHLFNTGRILEFKWLNEIEESFAPYDFTVIECGSTEELFIDVKTTEYGFEQALVFSKGELNFAKDNKYAVYRVFHLSESPKLRICRTFGKTAHALHNHFLGFSNALAPFDAEISDPKLAIRPIQKALVFEAPQDLKWDF